MADSTSEGLPERSAPDESVLDDRGAGPGAAGDIPAGDIPAGGEASAPAAPAAAPTTRTGAAFKSLIAGAIVLVLLLVFILENTESVKISFFGISGHMPLGVALLLAAIGGALLVGIVGAARIMQLRRHVRRRTRPRP